MIRFLGPTTLVVIWFVVTHAGLASRLLLPAPERVAVSLGQLFITGEVLPDVGSTVLRWLAGLALGILLGVPLGLVMGVSRRVHDSLEAVIDFFRSIPLMAMFPLFLVFFGVGDRSRVAIAGWTTVLYVLINTLYGVRHASPTRRMVARVFRATRWQTFSKVVFPEALPHIFVGMRISVSMSLVLVVAAEMIMGGDTGLGKRVFDAALTYDTPEMYATIAIAGTLGYLSNRLFVALEKRLVHWAGV